MIIVKRCKAKSDKRVASYEITVREGHNMIRSELIKKLEAENPELKTEEIEKIVDLFFNQIIQTGWECAFMDISSTNVERI